MKLARWAALLPLALSAPVAGSSPPLPSDHQTGPRPDRSEVLASAERMARWQLEALPRPDADGGALPPKLDPSLVQFIRSESAANPRSWHQGAFWLGMTRLADRSGSAWAKEAILAHGRSQQWRPAERTYNADDHLIGITYLWASRNGEGERALAPLRATFDAILQAPARTHLSLYLGDEGMRGYHKADCLKRWCWSDALFMAPATWIGLSRATGDARYRNFALAEFWASANFLYDPAERLYFRDSRFFAERDEQGRKIFWSRGNGWVLAGLALMLEELPARDPARQRLVAHFREFAKGIAQRQRADGFWSSALLDTQGTMPEASGTALFTFALARGVERGWLPAETFRSHALRGWAALERAKRPDGGLGWVQAAGDRPGASEASGTQLYATGAFLLAATAIYDLKKAR